MSKTNYTGYWIFYCNPNLWNAEKLIRGEISEFCWAIRSFQKNHFEIGQYGIFRIGTGSKKLQRGVYAIVRVESKPFFGPCKDQNWKSPQKISKEDREEERERVGLIYRLLRFLTHQCCFQC